MNAQPLTRHQRDAMPPAWVVEAHRRDSRGVAFTLDGSRIVTVGDDAPVRIWDADDGQLIRELPGHKRGGECLVMHPDGWRVLTGGRDKTARLWALDTGRQVHAFEGHAGAVTAVAISPDGEMIATADREHTVRIWQTATGDLMQTWKNKGDPARVLVFDAVDEFLWVWSADDAGVLVGCQIGDPRPHVRQTGKRVVALDPARDLAVVREAAGRAHAPQAALHRFDRKGVGRQDWRLEGHLGSVRCAAVTPKRYVVTGSADRGLRLFAAAGTVQLHLRAGGAACDRLAIDVENERFAVGDADGRLLVFTSEVVYVDMDDPPHDHAISAVGFDDLGRPWSIGRDGKIAFRDDDLEVVESHVLRPVQSMHGSAGFLDGAWTGLTPITLSSAAAYGIERWEMINRPSVETSYAIEGASAQHLAVGRTRIAVGVLDRSLHILDAETLTEVQRVDLEAFPEAVAISPDDTVAVIDEKGVLTVVAADGETWTRTERRARSLHFIDDEHLCLGRTDGKLAIVEIRGPTGPSTKGHLKAIVAIASDGDTVYTAGLDRRLVRWTVDGSAPPTLVETSIVPVPIQCLAARDGVLITGDAAGAMGRWLAPV